MKTSRANRHETATMSSESRAGATTASANKSKRVLPVVRSSSSEEESVSELSELTVARAKFDLAAPLCWDTPVQ